MINIKGAYNKNVEVTCISGNILKGFYSIYTQALDNECNIASIIIEDSKGSLIEIYENEIKEIQII